MRLNGWRPQSPAGDWDRPDGHWAAVLAAEILRIGHVGQPWFEHDTGLSWPGPEWRDAARTRGSVLLITGPFTGHHDFPDATTTAEYRPTMPWARGGRHRSWSGPAVRSTSPQPRGFAAGRPQRSRRREGMLDLWEVMFVDCPGLRVLVQARNQTGRYGGPDRPRPFPAAFRDERRNAR
jgi:hypothetical protein